MAQVLRMPTSKLAFAKGPAGRSAHPRDLAVVWASVLHVHVILCASFAQCILDAGTRRHNRIASFIISRAWEIIEKLLPFPGRGKYYKSFIYYFRDAGHN